MTIGNDVWIGQGVFIKSGVTIGDGAIIAARSAVISDVPPFAIVAGVPATIKKYRFSPDIIEALVSLKWWDYHIQDISNLLDYSDVLGSITTIRNKILDNKISIFNFERFSLK